MVPRGSLLHDVVKQCCDSDPCSRPSFHKAQAQHVDTTAIFGSAERAEPNPNQP